MIIDPKLALEEHPYRSFERWYALALEHDPQPEAMALATADADGAPSVRMVLFRGFSEQAAPPRSGTEPTDIPPPGQRGLRFFTHYDSPKGADLETRPSAALLFHWKGLGRQLRISGSVARLNGVESDAYFAGRERESQLGAWASHQSAPLASREVFLGELHRYREQFAGAPVPRPPDWGGYILFPQRFEFWQNQPNRLHDRFVYTLEEGRWRVQRLSP